MIHYFKNNLNQNKEIKLLLIIIILFQLFYLGNNKVNFSFETLKNSFKPDFGSEYILRQDILELKLIVNEKNFKLFNISKNLKNDNYFYQRAVEFLYPIKINEKDNKIFFTKKEKIPNFCVIKDVYKHLILAEC